MTERLIRESCGAPVRNRVGALVLCAMSFGSIGCGAGDNLEAAESVEKIVISPATLQLNIGESVHLSARAVGKRERDVPGASIAWSSQHSSVATVSSEGTVTALRLGTAVVTATTRTVSASVVVVVTSPYPTTSISVSSARSVLWVSDTLTAVPLVRIAGGIVNSPEIQWITSRPDIVGVTQAGVMRGIAPGVSIITALSYGGSASLTMTVVDIGTLHIEGARHIAPGWEAPLAMRGTSGASYVGPVQWTSSDSAVATVSADGVVHALHTGTSIVHGEALGQARDLTVTVRSMEGQVGVARGGALALLSLDESQAIVMPQRDGAPLSWQHMSLSPDGRTVAYDCGPSVCMAPLDASQRVEVLITKGSFPSWTGDGRTVAARTDYAEVGVVDVATRRLTRSRTIAYVERPRVSPDGMRVAYDCDYTEPYEDLSDVCVTPADGSARGSLLVANATRLAWSNNGASIAYLSRDGVCVSAANAGRPCLLVLPATIDNALTELAWSPDSRKLLVTRGREMWILDADGSNSTRQPSARYELTSPSWSASP